MFIKRKHARAVQKRYGYYISGTGENLIKLFFALTKAILSAGVPADTLHELVDKSNNLKPLDSEDDTNETAADICKDAD